MQLQERLLHGTKVGDGHANTLINIQIHLILLTVAWSGLANIALIAVMFKHNRIGFFIHSLLMGVVAIFSFVGPLLLIVPQGFHLDSAQATSWSIHKICGLIVLCVVGLQVILGIVSRCLQTVSSSSSGKSILTVKRIHMILGIILDLAAKFSIFTGWYPNNINVFIALLVVEGLFLLAHIIFYVAAPSLTNKGFDSQIQNINLQNVKKIKRKSDLKIFSSDYFIFSDFVYNLKNLYGKHPGGQYILQHIKQRQVDRFLFGMQPLQIQESAPRHSHSKWSTSLLGDPIAKFQRASYFEGLDNDNECRVLSLKKLTENSKVFMLELGPKSGQWDYQGLRQLSQLGQYHRLTIKNSISRLYTVVNCMQMPNRLLMSSISSQMQEKVSQSILMTENNEMSELKIHPTQMSENKIRNEETVHLLMKRYDDGDFTSELLNSNFRKNINLSCAKGEGLALHEKKPGHIFIVAGGTGIYPFIDVIDLLFKRMLVDSNHNLSQKIIEGTPAVKDSTLKTFKFTFIAAFKSMSDLHPITQYQCSKLGQKMPEKFKCIFKVQESNTNQKAGIQFVNERAEQILQKQINLETLSQIYICGPSRMTGSLLRMFREREIPTDKYKII